jgi:hypothetical protein
MCHRKRVANRERLRLGREGQARRYDGALDGDDGAAVVPIRHFDQAMSRRRMIRVPMIPATMP